MTLKAGFEFAEAQLLLEMAQHAYAGKPSLSEAPPTCGVPDVPNPSSNWAIVNDLTPTSATLLDNYWQVWQNQNDTTQYAVAVRGTVDSAASILADLLFPLINARFDVKLGSISLPFYLAGDEGDTAVKAGVHSGFALSLLLMLFTTDHPLFVTLFQLAQVGNNNIYITGHSQGASIATLLTSLVRHSTFAFKGPAYKTYTFAPAKAGNDHYAYDYARLAAVDGFGWAVTSTQDWVPQAPFSLEWISDLNTPNPLRAFSGASNPEAMIVLGGELADGESAINRVRDDQVKRLRQRVESVSRRLQSETIHLKASDLGAPSAAPITGSMVSDAIQYILDQIQTSLSYADSGALVPLFAIPGGNPTDGTPTCQKFDYFWQHHLGNYLKYLNEQYGG
jgi:hypothetical protein